MANLASKVANLTGVVTPVTTAASGGGDAFDNDGRTLVILKTSGTGSTVTFDSLVPSNYGTDVNPAVVMAATEQRVVGPFDPARFNDVNGRVGMSYTSVVGLTLDIVRM